MSLLLLLVLILSNQNFGFVFAQNQSLGKYCISMEKLPKLRHTLKSFALDAEKLSACDNFNYRNRILKLFNQIFFTYIFYLFYVYLCSNSVKSFLIMITHTHTHTHIYIYKRKISECIKQA